MTASSASPSQGQAEVDPLLGRSINDRYKVTAQIGSGGMGRVYKALQSPLDRVVALKVLGAGHDRDPNFYKRFFLEASVTAKLTHPNTITLYDYGRTEDGIFFIAMEYLNGRTLSQTMQSDGPLGQERVIHIAQQICRSLREAHALGIIHRDLKPANVMLLSQHDDHDFVKVLDFGLVKFFSGETEQDTDITNAGTFMGSPHYIAPEQARNQNPDQRCDIYSLGVLLYHMVTGKVPFTAPAPVDIILKHLHEEPVAPRKLRPDLEISPELEAVILKCMAKKREGRFQGMDELLQSLKLVRAQLTGTSGPHSLPPDTQDGLRALQTPSAQFAAVRTPSQPLPAFSTPSGGMSSSAISRPPPPPADAADDAHHGIHVVVSAPPASAYASTSHSRVERSGPNHLVIAAIAVAVIGAVVGGVVIGRRGAQPAETPVAAAAPVAASPAPAPAPVAAPASSGGAIETVSPAGTTLVQVVSAPSGAEVRDADDRLLGVTPFELRASSQKPLELRVHRDGYRTVTVKKVPSGERLPLDITLKKDPKSESDRGRKSVGYKDDPY